MVCLDDLQVLQRLQFLPLELENGLYTCDREHLLEAVSLISNTPDSVVSLSFLRP